MQLRHHDLRRRELLVVDNHLVHGNTATVIDHGNRVVDVNGDLNLVGISGERLVNRIVNDFSIIVGTVNGSGSSTANNTILRALFKMGIPVSGKNLFPSNIQGLPTWYNIRVNKDGYLARRDENEIVVAMNANSFARDLASVTPGGAFFYADDIKQPVTRSDIAVYAMPVKQLVRADANRLQTSWWIFTSLVSWTKKSPMTKVINATTTGYHRPA